MAKQWEELPSTILENPAALNTGFFQVALYLCLSYQHHMKKGTFNFLV